MLLHGCFLALAVHGAVLVSGTPITTNLVLVDVEGFEDKALYPSGDLQAVIHGGAVWQPANEPAQIVPVEEPPYETVLRRYQTGNDNTDFVRFPAVSNGVIRIEFDARVSTAAARTLDIFLLPQSGSQMASMLCWGCDSGKLSYYDGQAWLPAVELDRNWRRIEMSTYLSGPQFNTFDLRIDGRLIAAGLPWRHQFAPGTAFNRARIGGIRGPKGEYGEIDNLLITAEVLLPVPDEVTLGNVSGSNQRFRFSFPTQPERKYAIEATDSLTPAQWQPLQNVTGDGSIFSVSAPMLGAERYFRVGTLPLPAVPGRNDGYRGIWFTLGQFSEHGDKYSGGLGTYTANHVPIAVYAPEVNKTFFVYGGTVKDQRYLLIMASYYDHELHGVPQPTIVHDKGGVNDPHDNPSMCIDGEGYIWIFMSGRGRGRPGFKYRSRQPYSVGAFDLIAEQEFTYPQPWHVEGKGFFHLMTKYTAGRELYWETSHDGVAWSADRKLAGIGGHYQVSNVREEKVATFFNRHPGGNVDRRTDLYYLQSEDWGQTWTTADGTPVAVPLTTANNPARVIDYSSQNKLMYTLDLNFDREGRPLLLYITSKGHQPGPQNDPRAWTLTKWTGESWESYVVCESDHNYDFGSLYILEDRWLVIGPTEPGPQPYQTGGEMALWSSEDEGRTWGMVRRITRNSEFNHTYARRPVNAADPFFAFWADGNPLEVSESRLYFTNSDGTQVWRLPYDMAGRMEAPEVTDQ